MVMGIRALDKPRNIWCTHCSTRRRCDSYDTRPEECRTFDCGYITISYLDEKWKPVKSKIVLVQELGGRRVTAYVDPARPDAWRKQPYYNVLKEWSKIALTQNRQVMACVGKSVHMIFPDRDENMGPVEDDHHVITVREGGQAKALVVHQDDPRLQDFLNERWSMAG